MWKPSAVAVVVLALAAVASAEFVPYTPKWVLPSEPALVASHRSSSLWSIAAEGYTDPILLVDVKASTRYDIGVDYGYLLANQSAENYHSLMSFVSPNPLVQDVLIWFLDHQYANHLHKQLPADMIDEIKGVNDGAAMVGVAGVGDMMTRGLTLASIATGDVPTDIEWIIIDELFPPKGSANHGKPLAPASQSLRDRIAAMGWTAHDVAEVIRADSGSLLRQHCSMFGAFGSRTVGGDLFSGRNLDWSAGTGIAKHKVLAVYHIPGAPVESYVTVGFAGLLGALTGMSSAGLTVHEAGNDNKVVTLDGFAWSMRLRYIMEQARDLKEAVALWEATNNTLGLNHGIGSAADKSFLCLETKAGYSAYFGANDEREANLTVDGTHIGAPMPDAVWRTNHGYDPEWLSTVAFPLRVGENSVIRYFLLRDTLKLYEREGVAMNLSHALNISSVLGAKDKGEYTNCSNDSSNILSTAYHPAELKMYVAWENGLGSEHVGACCNNYVFIDMSRWLKPNADAAEPSPAATAAHADVDADTDAAAGDGSDDPAPAEWKSAFHA